MIIPTFYIDGAPFTFPCSVSRNVEKRESGNSGYMLDDSYNNDLLGTYITYSVQIEIPKDKFDKYTSLYNLLAAPKSEYTFTMPYNQETITFNGRIQNINDKLVRVVPNGNGQLNIWSGITFDIISNEPIIEVE